MTPHSDTRPGHISISRAFCKQKTAQYRVVGAGKRGMVKPVSPQQEQRSARPGRFTSLEAPGWQGSLPEHRQKFGIGLFAAIRAVKAIRTPER